MGCVNVKLSDEVRNSPIFPEKRSSTNVFWLLIFLGVIFFTLAFVFTCYQSSNWYNIKDIQDYDGSGLIIITQNAVVYYKNIIIAVASAIGICLAVLLLMMWLSSIFMVLSLGVVSLYFIVLVALIWEQYDKVRETPVLVAGILMSLLMVLWFFFFVRIGKKIELIFLLFHLAASAMKNSLRMILYAIFIFLLNAFVLIVCAYFFCVVTAAWMEFRKYNDETPMNMSWINWTYASIVIMAMWWLHFTQGCLNFLVGYAVGGWYFKHPIIGKEWFQFNGSLDLIMYHLGTMCFGSFILTIFWVIREILDFFRQFKLNDNFLSFIGSFAEWILVCTQACWEIAATNSNYITSMYGFGYCTSTRRTIEIADNAAQLSVGLVGNALVYICVLMVALVSATIGVTVFEVEAIDEQITLGAVLFLITFGVSWMLLSVYVNITRAIYVCICIDVEANGVGLAPEPVDELIIKYVTMVPKFCPPPPPPVQAPPPILPKGKRYEDDSEEEEVEEQEQMVQIIVV